MRPLILASSFLFLIFGGVAGAKEVVLNCKWSSYRKNAETKVVENIKDITVLNLQKKTLHFIPTNINTEIDYFKLIIDDNFYRAFFIEDPKVNYKTDPITIITIVSISRHDGSYKKSITYVPLEIGKKFIEEDKKTSDKKIIFEKLNDYVSNYSFKNWNNPDSNTTSNIGMCSQIKEKL